MESSQRIPAFISYFLPVVGWIYVGVFQRKNPFAIFHMRQSICLALFAILITLAWGAVTWVLAWIPYAFVFGMVLFTCPWLAISSASSPGHRHGQCAARLEAPLPLIGAYSSKLPM
jgi:uncharacterized membrane protein